MISGKFTKIWLLVLPVLAWFYIGLFLTMEVWYPQGLATEEFRAHLINFTIVYVLWLISFFVYTLFDLQTYQKSLIIIGRLIAAMGTNAIIAISYFYFQPELIITPRRFLLVHLFITTIGLALWFVSIQSLLPKIWKRKLLIHQKIYNQNLNIEIENIFEDNKTLGWQLAGRFEDDRAHSGDTVIIPSVLNFNQEELQELFAYKQLGVEFLEFHKFYEQTKQTIQLTDLNEVWFLNSISYRKHQFYDSVKRLVDLVVGFIGTIFLVIFFPILAILIKMGSSGKIFFSQPRTGQNGQVFILYKFRTMSGGATNTWTAHGDTRITKIGYWLRKLRLDELPQFFNIFRGDMSLVGPRPEQVHIVAQLKAEIPYYNERHIVKPGLTGWSQLHIYASTVEQSKLKLQYDLYYIKHRSLWFDLEVILRTIFHFITLQGK